METNVAPSVHGARPSAAAILKCPRCSWDNVRDRRFCGGCGAELNEPCIECGAAVGIEERHCGSCGVNLATALESRREQAHKAIVQARALADAQRHIEAIA